MLFVKKSRNERDIKFAKKKMKKKRENKKERKKEVERKKS